MSPEPHTLDSHTAAPAPRTERALAWTCTGLACLYFAWLFGVQWRASGAFRQMFEGLGLTDLPWTTGLVTRHETLVFGVLLAVFVFVAVGKELVVRDKRLSVMITLLVVLVAQFVAHVALTAYYRPMIELIEKLG